MPPISLWQLLDHAAEHGFDGPAFNLSNLEPGFATTIAARARAAPMNPQASLNVRRSCEEGVLDSRVAVA